MKMNKIVLTFMVLVGFVSLITAAVGDPNCFGTNTTRTACIGGTNGIVNASGNITTLANFSGVNIYLSGLVSALNGAFSNNVSVTGNVSASNFFGTLNASWVSNSPWLLSSVFSTENTSIWSSLNLKAKANNCSNSYEAVQNTTTTGVQCIQVVSGSGTANSIPKFTGTYALGNSLMTQGTGLINFTSNNVTNIDTISFVNSVGTNESITTNSSCVVIRGVTSTWNIC